MNKDISIIVPCYNVEKYVDRCLDTLINQTLDRDKIEIICVNDASEDSTLEKLLEWEKRYPESILVINSAKNCGIGGARNVGLSYSSGKYIGFVDADDWLELTMFEKMHQAMITYDCDIVRCCHLRDNGHGNIWDTQDMRFAADSLLDINNDEERRKFLASDIMDGGCTDKLYTRSIIYDNKISFVENLAYEDVPWGILFYLYVKKVYFLNEKLYHYYVNEDSVVLSANKEHHMDLFRTSLIKLEECYKRGAMVKFQKEIELSFLITYYLGGVKMLALRFTDYKYEKFKEMCECIRTVIPDYAQNPYIKDMLDDIYKLLLELIDKNISFEEYKEVTDIVRRSSSRLY